MLLWHSSSWSVVLWTSKLKRWTTTRSKICVVVLKEPDSERGPVFLCLGFGLDLQPAGFGAGQGVGVKFLWKYNSLRSDIYFWQKPYPHHLTVRSSVVCVFYKSSYFLVCFRGVRCNIVLVVIFPCFQWLNAYLSIDFK